MPTIVERVLAAALDALTAVVVIAYWAGVWCYCDARSISEYKAGAACVILVLVFAFGDMHTRLEEHSSGKSQAMQTVVKFFWTGFMAVLSIIIWRTGFFIVDSHIKSNLHAALLALVSACILFAAGRFRGAGNAPSVGIISDFDPSRSKLPPASFSGSQPAGILLDMLLLGPSIFVWAAVWMLFDNHVFNFGTNMTAPQSALIIGGLIAAFSVSAIDDYMRDALSGKVAVVADVLWTAFLALLCIGLWRGVWATLEMQLHLSTDAHNSAYLALAGALCSAALQRHRSALFTPMEYALDDGSQFVAVGSRANKETLPFF